VTKIVDEKIYFQEEKMACLQKIFDQILAKLPDREKYTEE